MSSQTAIRVSELRQRRRQAGLRQISVWIPDTEAQIASDALRRQSQAIRDSERRSNVLSELDSYADELLYEALQ
jgi:hypothetical protein